MRGLAWSLIVLMLVPCVTPAPSQAQLAVIDVANLERNTWTSIQSTITAVQAVLLAIDSALNMVSFGSSSLDGFESTVGEFVAIANEARIAHVGPPDH